jgi:hypothetical protein
MYREKALEKWVLELLWDCDFSYNATYAAGGEL